MTTASRLATRGLSQMGYYPVDMAKIEMSRSLQKRFDEYNKKEKNVIRNRQRCTAEQKVERNRAADLEARVESLSHELEFFGAYEQLLDQRLTASKTVLETPVMDTDHDEAVLKLESVTIEDLARYTESIDLEDLYDKLSTLRQTVTSLIAKHVKKETELCIKAMKPPIENPVIRSTIEIPNLQTKSPEFRAEELTKRRDESLEIIQQTLEEMDNCSQLNSQIVADAKELKQREKEMSDEIDSKVNDIQRLVQSFNDSYDEFHEKRQQNGQKWIEVFESYDAQEEVAANRRIASKSDIEKQLLQTDLGLVDVARRELEESKKDFQKAIDTLKAKTDANERLKDLVQDLERQENEWKQKVRDAEYESESLMLQINASLKEQSSLSKTNSHLSSDEPSFDYSEEDN